MPLAECLQFIEWWADETKARLPLIHYAGSGTLEENPRSYEVQKRAEHSCCCCRTRASFMRKAPRMSTVNTALKQSPCRESAGP